MNASECTCVCVCVGTEMGPWEYLQSWCICVSVHRPLCSHSLTVISEVQILLPYLTGGKVEALNPMLSCVTM